jgi:hypothetical protein
MTEMDIETSVYYVHLTRLIAQEDFIKFSTSVYYHLFRYDPVRKLLDTLSYLHLLLLPPPPAISRSRSDCNVAAASGHAV